MPSSRGGHPSPHALDLQVESVVVAGTTYRLLRPRDLDALVDEQSFRFDEFVPYWAELWPSAVALAEALPLELRGCRIVELGCGLGLPALVSARRGAVVTAVDWSVDAVSVLRRNAAHHGLELTVEVVEWSDRRWFSERSPWDLVLAADVLYERRNVEPLIQLLPELASEVLLADPGRPALGDFLEAAEDQWELSDEAPGVLRMARRWP